MTKDNTYSALKAQWRAERQEHKHNAFIDCQTSYVREGLIAAYGPASWKGAIQADIRQTVSDWSSPKRHFWRHVDRDVAARHEGGHFILAEREGFRPHSAEVAGSPFDHHGWSGEVVYLNPPHFGDCFEPAEAALKRARVALGGPLSEELTGNGGGALCRCGEMMLARVYVGHAAELFGCDSNGLWIENLRKAASLIENFYWEVREIAELLMRKHRITRDQRAVKQILAAVNRAPLQKIDISDRAGEVVNRIVAANVPNFAVEVRK